MTASDLILPPHLSMFAMTEEGNDVLSGHPVLTAWLERTEARPSMQATTWEKLLAGGPIWGTTSGRRGRNSASAIAW